MSAIEKALDEVRFQIPYEILNEAFKEDPVIFGRSSGFKTSVRAAIREEVIDKKVLVDVNLLGGVEVSVALDNATVIQSNDMGMVVKIPKKLTGGRTITSALSVAEGSLLRSNTPYVPSSSFGSMVENNLDAMLNANSYGMGNLIDARVRVIGENTIYIRIPDTQYSNLILRCRVGSDPMMSDLPPTAWLEFSKLVVYATQAIIYRKLQIKMDEGKLSGGLNLGRFKEIVDEYRDAHQLYREQLEETWPRVAAISDETRHNRAIKAQFGFV